ncbi:MAG: dipeptide/oligopeptide/nickel ABC transporter ATP-binding protein [Deltaproteobacteria bacterium]|jgi:ABC-type oligopeptide transport system ATPase subunit|nr:dipeptide/oligopeptide/nickel ABC transporter ATP-binding protein [Deltaproteobacteria bacterium]
MTELSKSIGNTQSILSVCGLGKTYRLPGLWRRTRLTALSGVTFEILKGTTYGLVGESGGGKSTVGKIICGLTKADAGQVMYKGRDLLKFSKRDRKQISGQIQLVFQDCLGAFDPRQSALAALSETLYLRGQKSKKAREEQAKAMLREVGLGLEQEGLRPFELSGGQRQRLNIARALLNKPEILICDEPVSALDVSIQAQILNLLRKIQRERRLTMLFISHDLPVARLMSDTIGVMQNGRLIEEVSAEDLPDGAKHLYTKELLRASQ